MSLYFPFLMFQASSEEEFQGMTVGKGGILKVIFVGEFFFRILRGCSCPCFFF